MIWGWNCGTMAMTDHSEAFNTLESGVSEESLLGPLFCPMYYGKSIITYQSEAFKSCVIIFNTLFVSE